MQQKDNFPFENTEVYKKAMDFVKLCRQIIKALPKSYYTDGDQLKRASLSVCNNYAEGYGRWGKKDKKYFYSIARGSAFECVPVLTLLHKEDFISDKKINTLRDCIMQVTKMLSGMITGLDNRKN